MAGIGPVVAHIRDPTGGRAQRSTVVAMRWGDEDPDRIKAYLAHVPWGVPAQLTWVDAADIERWDTGDKANGISFATVAR